MRFSLSVVQMVQSERETNIANVSSQKPRAQHVFNSIDLQGEAQKGEALLESTGQGLNESTGLQARGIDRHR